VKGRPHDTSHPSNHPESLSGGVFDFHFLNHGLITQRVCLILSLFFCITDLKQGGSSL
jgi:hypothetical protein